MEHHISCQKAKRHGWTADGVAFLGYTAYTLLRRGCRRIAVHPTTGRVWYAVGHVRARLRPLTNFVTTERDAVKTLVTTVRTLTLVEIAVIGLAATAVRFYCL